MATYGYNNGFGNTYSYGYNNGNYSTQTTVVNGVAYQKNVTTIGGGSCGADNTCPDGYSLYFPCLKNITRGQNVCFDFYVGDNANQDELDLRDLDSLTIDLSGMFGCPYKSYTYPEDITPLQTERYKEIYCNDFNNISGNICELKLKYFDNKFANIRPNITGKIGKFYVGSEIRLYANDTPTHIFVGWGKQHDDSDLGVCMEIIDGIEYEYDSAYDYIISTNREYVSVITEDTELYAIYRERRDYEIRVSFDNRHSHFEVYTDDKRYYLSDKERDIVHILEGYKFSVICKPNKSFLKDDEFYYNFVDWCDRYKLPARVMVADDDNPLLKKGGKIMLLANCVKNVHNFNIDNEVEEVVNNFEYRYPDENILFNEIEYRIFFTDDNIVEAENTCLAYMIDNNGLLYITDGSIKTKEWDIENGIKIIVKVVAETDSVLNFEVNGEIIPYNIEAGFSGEFECLFRHCNFSYVKLGVEGKLYIDNLCIYEEIIDDKGKAQLCIPSEDTALMHPGALYASGAIGVDGNVFGLPQTMIGSINNLKTINII